MLIQHVVEHDSVLFGKNYQRLFLFGPMRTPRAPKIADPLSHRKTRYRGREIPLESNTHPVTNMVSIFIYNGDHVEPDVAVAKKKNSGRAWLQWNFSWTRLRIQTAR